MPVTRQRAASGAPVLRGPRAGDAEKDTEVMISAQPILADQSGDEQARLAVQQGLCRALGFSMADLAANQRGLLSEQQISSLPREIRRDGRFVVGQVTGDVRMRRVHVPGEEGPGSNAYFYELSGFRFQVPHAAGAALGGPGLRHQVYYLEGADLLLSIEPLPFQR